MSHLSECVLHGIKILITNANENGFSNLSTNLIELHLQIHQHEINKAISDLFKAEV